MAVWTVCARVLDRSGDMIEEYFVGGKVMKNVIRS